MYRICTVVGPRHDGMAGQSRTHFMSILSINTSDDMGICMGINYSELDMNSSTFL